jgi:hypothetical protein
LAPHLLAPRRLAILLLVAVPVVLVLVLAGPTWDLGTLREMAASPDGLEIARRMAMRVVTSVCAVVGFFAGSAVFDTQRMHASWGFPHVRAGMRAGVVALVVTAAALGGTGVGAWVSAGDALRIGLVGVMVGACAASVGQVVVGLGTQRFGVGGPVVALSIMVLAPSWMLAFADVVGWPGLLAAATGSVGLAWWSTSAAAHRAVAAWVPAVGTPAVAAADAMADAWPNAAGEGRRAAMPPARAWHWVRRLRGEAAAMPLGTLLPLPGIGLLAVTSAGIAVMMHLADTSPVLFGLFASQSPPLAAATLLYPLSRRGWATVQLLDHAVELAVVTVVAGSVFAVMRAMEVPVLPYFADERPSAVPQLVQFAMAMALLPMANAGRWWLPRGSASPALSQHLLWPMLAFIPYGLAVIEGTRRVWQLSGHAVGASVVWSVVLGAVVQGVNYRYCLWVMSRRDWVVKA